MRVLVVTPWFPTAKRPSFTPFMVRDVEMLQRDHEVVVLHLGHPNDLVGEQTVIEQDRVVRVPFHHTMPSTWLRAAKILRSFAKSADVVHTMALPALLPAALARIRVPWIHTEHYSGVISPPVSRRQAFSLGIFKQLLRLPDRVVGVGKPLAAALAKYRHDEVPVIPNHVEVSLGVKGEGPGLSSSTVDLVSVGALVPNKGPIEAVQTLAELRRRGVDASLTWVGDGPLLEKVCGVAAQLGVSEHVSLPGAVLPGEVGHMLESADLFLLPTAYETFGVALAEALAAGLPVVASGTGGHLDFLPEWASRMADRSPVALADAVQALLLETEDVSRERIRSYAAGCFRSGRRRDEYREVYSTTISAWERT